MGRLLHQHLLFSYWVWVSEKAKYKQNGGHTLIDGKALKMLTNYWDFSCYTFSNIRGEWNVKEFMTYGEI